MSSHADGDGTIETGAGLGATSFTLGTEVRLVATGLTLETGTGLAAGWTVETGAAEQGHDSG